MHWFFPDDHTEGVITAERHIQSAHGNQTVQSLPETCVVFEMSGALHHLSEIYETVTLSEGLPAFLTNPPCIALQGNSDVCFVQGAYGAPAAVDVLETLHALGVRRIIVAGMCGVFVPDTRVGDCVIPKKILSEEGTSRHYAGDAMWAYPDAALARLAEGWFTGGGWATGTVATVTTDAVYRQTFHKEALWRDMGCAGVDMEASALLTAGRALGMEAVAILLVSDLHPLSPGDKDWAWGDDHFRGTKRRFWEHIAGLTRSLPPP